jgi:hypothetical protein
MILQYQLACPKGDASGKEIFSVRAESISDELGFH